MDHDYTQRVSEMGFTHGQLYFYALSQADSLRWV